MIASFHFKELLPFFISENVFFGFCLLSIIKKKNCTYNFLRSNFRVHAVQLHHYSAVWEEGSSVQHERGYEIVTEWGYANTQTHSD